MPRLKITSSEIEKYLTLLEETPKRIELSLAGLDASRLSLAPGLRQWSGVEILAHLRACEDLWSYSIYAMLAETQPILALLDERRWAKTTGYASLDFQTSFEIFKLKRAELLRVLRNLSEESWSRSATIEGRSHTVFSQARRMALHEQEHCSHIEALYSQNEKAV
jgi:hypothetical protein